MMPNEESAAPGETSPRASDPNVASHVRSLVEQLPPGFDMSTLLAIADALPVMVAYCDRALRYRFVNRPLAEWMGVERETILGKTIKEVMGAESFAPRAPMLEAALEGEAQWFAADYAHETRGALTTQADYVPHVDEEGAVIGLVIIVQDVTEQRVAGQALTESETRFRRIADSTPVPMWVARRDGSREFVNQAYADFLGAPAKDAAAIGWEDRVHPDDEEPMRDALIEGLKSEAPFEFEARAKCHDGSYRWMQAMVQPRRDSEGHIIGYIGCANDVTLAKEAELSLRERVENQQGALDASEARFRAVFDSLDMVGIMDLQGRYLELNATSRQGLGLDRADFSARHAWELPPVVGVPESAATMRRLIEAGARGEAGEAEIEVELHGQRAAHIISITPVPGADGTPQYLVGQARDVTALKSAQDQLRQAQKMEALGQLTGGLAHDFNNLLTVVVGGLDMISRKVEDERLKRYADNALSAAQRGARLTGQLLTFSRVQKLEVKSVNVGQVIADMKPLFGNALGGRFDVIWRVEDEAEHILTDTTQLEVALLNLAINARDAMADGGTLTVATRRVELSGDAEVPSGTYLELAIADTGSGMEPAVAERVFEPFFTTKQVGKGTGLGLSMVYGMVRQSGGTARIDSVPGEGTTVRLFFRLADADAQAGEEEVTGGGCAQSVAGKRILVIDDDSDVRGFIEETLADMGADVRACADGTEGLAAYAEWRPDLIVVDYAMPGLSGAEVAAAILDETPGQPILFISGYSETEAIRKLAPDAPLLAKPFSPGELEGALCGMLPV